jgi:hypothetical protein
MGHIYATARITSQEHNAAKFTNIGCSLHSDKLNQITAISIMHTFMYALLKLPARSK